MEQEKILQQREFNQALVKFRGVNRAMKEGVTKMTKEQNESFLKGNPPLENVYQPVAGIMQTVK